MNVVFCFYVWAFENLFVTSVALAACSEKFGVQLVIVYNILYILLTVKSKCLSFIVSLRVYIGYTSHLGNMVHFFGEKWIPLSRIYSSVCIHNKTKSTFVNKICYCFKQTSLRRYISTFFGVIQSGGDRRLCIVIIKLCIFR